MRVWTRTCQQHYQWQMKNLRVILLSFVKTTKSLLKILLPNLTTSTGQINTDLIDWRQQARDEAFKEVVPDAFSASQAVNVVSDDDEDDQEENTPRHLTTSEALQHLYDLLHSSMMENDATLIGLTAEVTDRVQNIKLSPLKQSNIKKFSLKSWITEDKILNIYYIVLYIVFILFLPKILLALFEVVFAIP